MALLPVCYALTACGTNPGVFRDDLDGAGDDVLLNDSDPVDASDADEAPDQNGFEEVEPNDADLDTDADAAGSADIADDTAVPDTSTVSDLPEGERCASSVECEDGLWCSNGRCVPEHTAYFPAGAYQVGPIAYAERLPVDRRGIYDVEFTYGFLVDRYELTRERWMELT